MNRTIILATSLIAAMTTGVLADTIDKRQSNQADRIQQARRSGELNLQESLSLRAEQARIRDLETRVKADGVVTRSEARAVDRAQDAASRHIAQESHDSQKAWYRKWF